MRDCAQTRALLKQAGTTYPEVTNGSLRYRINRAIRDAAYDAIPEYDPGTPVIEAVGKYTAELNDRGILSLRFEDYYYPEMAAHGVTGVSSITVDLCDGHVYDFEELFKPGSDYQDQINRIVEEQIVAGQIPMLRPFAGVGPDEDYYLTPQSLVLYYQPYVYTPGAYGVLEFIIPYTRIMEIIDPQGPIGRLF